MLLNYGLTMVYGRYNELVNGDYFMVYKPTNTGWWFGTWLLWLFIYWEWWSQFQRGRSTTSSDRIETMNSYWNNYGDDWGSPMTSGKPAPRLPWRERRGTRSNDAQFLPAPRETLSTNCPMDPHFLLVGGDWNMAGLFSMSYMGMV